MKSQGKLTDGQGPWTVRARDTAAEQGGFNDSILVRMCGPIYKLTLVQILAENIADVWHQSARPIPSAF